jgi:hypothetical protein
MGVFDEFCKNMDDNTLDKNIEHRYTVNEKKSSKSDRLGERAHQQQVDPTKQMINLSWRPDKNNDGCRASCHDVYTTLAQSGCKPQLAGNISLARC